MTPELICNILTTLATIGAVIVALIQLQKTLRQETANRLEDRYNELRNEAFLVDAWVAVTTDPTHNNARVWHVVLDNETTGVIRDVQVHVQWPGLSTTNLDEHGLGVMPLARKPWLTIPAGSWRINYEKRSDNIIWSMPVRIHDPYAEMNPSFFDPADNKQGQIHDRVILQFTDAYDNQWCRVYKTHSTPDDLTPGLYLIDTANKQLERFKSSPKRDPKQQQAGA
ncbi:hypothetical protein DSM100688_0551 [Bifidobacterium ramosum]|uniref:Uncharacterized protein n=1 Tax=Bifidobacterium ramosum TaxID=1798158 RepID=A0A6L4X0X9_9BIFI|nr:hypothetical protein [Bifidobacterium ramosum]KAB8288549.1 hypothetical protein DSM100688_0551 [Bifidobacterium ramosum]NEG71753.1 hypothetical protein [Bifidobacterium ramosum]